MNHESKYRIPDFRLHTLIQLEYGLQGRSAPNGYYFPCMIHDHSNPSKEGGDLRVYLNDSGIDGYVCHRGDNGNIWDFVTDVMGYPGPHDPAFDDTLLHIYDLLDEDPVLRENYQPTPTDEARRLMADIRDHLSPIQFENPNPHYQQAENGQWMYRGLPPMSWLQYDVGMLPEGPRKKIFGRYNDQAIQAAGISRWKNAGYAYLSWGVLVIRRNKHGSPIGFAVRLYPEKAGNVDATYVKNRSSSDILNTQSYLFGEDGLKDTDANEIYIVEGEFDQLALRVRGQPNTLTHGSGQPAHRQLDRLRDEMDEHLVFIADADTNRAGFNHMAQTAERAPEAEFIFLPGQDTDPEEYVRNHGVEALQDLYRYTSRQVRMIAEDAYDWNQHQWSNEQTALASKYMKEIINQPTPRDEDDVSMLASLNSQSEEYFRSWLFTERNRQALTNVPQQIR